MAKKTKKANGKEVPRSYNCRNTGCFHSCGSCCLLRTGIPEMLKLSQVYPRRYAKKIYLEHSAHKACSP